MVVEEKNQGENDLIGRAKREKTGILMMSFVMRHILTIAYIANLPCWEPRLCPWSTTHNAHQPQAKSNSSPTSFRVRDEPPSDNLSLVPTFPSKASIPLRPAHPKSRKVPLYFLAIHRSTPAESNASACPNAAICPEPPPSLVFLSA